jgi:hypothetical protein
MTGFNVVLRMRRDRIVVAHHSAFINVSDLRPLAPWQWTDGGIASSAANEGKK